MDDIKKIVNNVIGNIAEQTPDVHNKVERIWANILNDSERKHTKIIGVKDDGLLVLVDSPAWLYQMRIRRTKLVKQLKDEIPHIKYIRFKMGKVT